MESSADTHTPTAGAPSAHAEYTTRLASLSAQQSREQRRERLLGYSKLALAAFVVIAAGFLIHHVRGLLMLLIPIAAFIVLAILQEKLIASIRVRTRAIRFYERGLARLEDRWSGGGETGDRFLDPAHPYARDLDLFGVGSLFDYLCTARTRTGEESLARWLLAAAPPAEILDRQAAVRELAPRLDLREQLYSSGESVRNAVDPAALAAWGESNPVLTSAATRIVSSILAILWLLSIPAWLLWDAPAPFFLISIANFAWAHQIHARLERAAAGIEKSAADLRLLAEALCLLEREQFTAAALLRLQSSIRVGAVAPSAAIRTLARLAEIIESRHSLFARPFDLVTFWSAQLIFLAEQWQRKRGPSLRAWLAAVGELEALASLSAFAFDHPNYAFPELISQRPAESAPQFTAQALAHPLLPTTNAVENDLVLDASTQLMILSGPNMAGKSTFIRCVGINAVLAQCGAPVRARSLRMSPLQVTASICILDSLSGGISRLYAEIRRLKMIASLAAGPVPVLFLLDELLSGTNSHDRFTGTRSILRSLVDSRAIGIVSTHDLALTRIPESMEGRAFNAHFEDHLEGDTLVFDYKLKPGVVQTSNALKLMRAIGLTVQE